MASGIQDAILNELEKNGGQIEGTEQIALNINVRRKSWLREIFKRMSSQDMVIVISSNGGRGHKTKVLKRNRNSPGQPRKQ